MKREETEHLCPELFYNYEMITSSITGIRQYRFSLTKVVVRSATTCFKTPTFNKNLKTTEEKLINK